MAKNKNNNILYIGIAVVVVVVVVALCLVFMNKNKDNGNNGDDGGNGTSQTSGDDTSNGSGLKASELENVDVVVEYGDYDAMYDLSKSIQNGEMVGQVVRIDGDVSHPMSTYSIVQQNSDGSQSIGTQFVIDGDAEYPEDEAHVVITGKVIEQSPMVFVIQTLPEFVEVLSAGGDNGDYVEVDVGPDSVEVDNGTDSAEIEE